jgi:hypothetical protein
MNQFHSVRAAKEFLVSQIVDEAQRENVILSEPERRMLYFSESGSTLPEMSTVTDEFDRAYDYRDYERKIAALFRRAAKHARKKSAQDYDILWQAIRRLRREDHYLNVLIRQAGVRPRGDLLRLWSTGIAVVLAFLALIILSINYGIDPERYLPSRGTVTLYVWATLFMLAIVYSCLRLFLGAKRVNDWLGGIVERLVRLRGQNS